MMTHLEHRALMSHAASTALGMWDSTELGSEEEKAHASILAYYDLDYGVYLNWDKDVGYYEEDV